MVMTNKEAIEFLKNIIDRETLGAIAPKGDGYVALWEYHVMALNMAIAALQKADSNNSTAESAQNVQIQGFNNSNNGVNNSIQQLNNSSIKLKPKRSTLCEALDALNKVIDDLEAACGHLIKEET